MTHVNIVGINRIMLSNQSSLPAHPKNNSTKKLRYRPPFCLFIYTSLFTIKMVVYKTVK